MYYIKVIPQADSISNSLSVSVTPASGGIAAREAVKPVMAGLKVAAIECKLLAIKIARNEKAWSVQSTRARDATNKAIQATIKAHQKAIKELDKKISTEETGIPV